MNNVKWEVEAACRGKTGEGGGRGAQVERTHICLLPIHVNVAKTITIK